MPSRPTRFPFRVLTAAGLAAGLGFSPSIRAQAPAPANTADTAEADAFIDSLYGKRIETVQRTRETEDDRALMSEMLDIAATLPSKPDARSALYARLVDITKRSRTGYDLALKGLAALAKHNPGHPLAGVQGRLDLYEAWYRGAERGERDTVAGAYFDELVGAADAALGIGDTASAKRWYTDAASVQRVARLERDFDIRDKLTALRVIEQIESDVQRLQDAARAGTIKPADARRLVVLLVLELGRVKDAGDFTALAADPEFDKGLRAVLAIGPKDLMDPQGEHAPGTWYLAGQWFASLVDEPGLSEGATKRTIEIARTALRQFIEKTPQEGIEKARAAIQLRQLDERYAQAFGPEVDERDVLRLLDPKKHTLAGQPFTAVEGKLVVPPRTIIQLPVDGGDYYALTIKVEADGRKEDALVVWLPVGGKHVRFFVDGSKHHRANVEGLPAIEGSEDKMRLEPGKPAEIRIKARTLGEDRALFVVDFNGQQMWAWTGKTEDFTKPKYGEPSEAGQFSIMGAAGMKIEKIQLERFEEKD